tara:strand:- start:30200 stop:33535 length:3336 start_codon:yes stop_codon:yes gene_type:complete
MPSNEYLLKIRQQGAQTTKKGLRSVTGSLTKMAGAVGVTVVAFQGLRAVWRTLDEGVNSWRKFEKGMREVRTLMTDKQPIEEMRKELELLASRTGQTFDVLTKAKYDAVSAGFASAADSAKLLSSASKLAVGGATDVGTAMDLLTSALNAYGLDANDAIDVSDQLFSAVRIGKTTISELAGSLGSVMPVARLANLQLKDVGAAMGVLTTGGLNSAEASTALRAMLMGLVKTTPEAQMVMDDLGISIRRYEDGTMDLLSTMKQFEDLDEETLTKIIPNVRAIVGVSRFKDAISATDQAIKDMSTTMTEGATQQAFEEMSQSADFQFTRLKNNMLSLKTAFGQMITNGVMPFVKDFNKEFDRLQVIGMDDITKSLTQDPTPLLNYFNEVGRALGRILRKGFNDAISSFGALLPQMVSSLVGNLPAIFLQLSYEIGAGIRKMINTPARELEVFTSNIYYMMRKSITRVVYQWDILKYTIQSYLVDMVIKHREKLNKVISYFNNFFSLANKAWNLYKGTARGAFLAIKLYAQTAINGMISAVNNLVASFRYGFTYVGDFMGKKFEEIKKQLIEFVRTSSEYLNYIPGVDIDTSKLDKKIEVSSQIINTYDTNLKNLASGGLSALTDASKKANKGWVIPMLDADGTKQQISTLVSDMSNYVQGKTNKLSKDFKENLTKAFQIGELSETDLKDTRAKLKELIDGLQKSLSLDESRWDKQSEKSAKKIRKFYDNILTDLDETSEKLFNKLFSQDIDGETYTEIFTELQLHFKNFVDQIEDQQPIIKPEDIIDPATGDVIETELEKQLGFFQKFWNKIKGGSKDTWDKFAKSFENVGERMEKGYKELEEASRQVMSTTVQTAMNSADASMSAGENARNAMKEVIKTEVQNIVAKYVGSIFASVPYPINLMLAAGAGAVIGTLMNRVLDIGASTGTQSVSEQRFGLAENTVFGGYNEGGYISSKLGSGIKDDVPAMLTAGEYVMRKQAVDKYGLRVMSMLNKGLISGDDIGILEYAEGGMVAGLIGSQALPSNFSSSQKGELELPSLRMYNRGGKVKKGYYGGGEVKKGYEDGGLVESDKVSNITININNPMITSTTIKKQIIPEIKHALRRGADMGFKF